MKCYSTVSSWFNGSFCPHLTECNPLKCEIQSDACWCWACLVRESPPCQGGHLRRRYGKFRETQKSPGDWSHRKCSTKSTFFSYVVPKVPLIESISSAVARLFPMSVVCPCTPKLMRLKAWCKRKSSYSKFLWKPNVWPAVPASSDVLAYCHSLLVFFSCPQGNIGVTNHSN